jgi:predicted SprT family Zn-dependent metalloprotease
MDIRQANLTAIELMDKYGLLDKGWCFKFDNAKVRFGCCNYTDKVITLSRHLCKLNSKEKVVDTILHEIAHALCPGQHHNHVWRRKAIEIGCSGNRCYSATEVVQPKLKYTAVCKGCNTEFNRTRVVRKNSSCGKCSNGAYNENFKLFFKQNY